MTRHVFRIAYDGRGYHGFQRQSSVATVEGELFEAVRELTGDRPSEYSAAGRTDAGVSALAQTIAFDGPDWLGPEPLNSKLPTDIRIWGHARPPEEFHARYDADQRTYRYWLHAAPDGSGALLHEPEDPVLSEPIDEAAVRSALARLDGLHDFHNFTPDDRGTERTVAISVEREGDFLNVRCTADGFPRQLVRRILGVAIAIGTGDRPIEDLDRLLGPDAVDGPAGVRPAPALPLVLSAVEYPNLTFAVSDDTAVAEAFTARRVQARTVAKVAKDVVEGVTLE